MTQVIRIKTAKPARPSLMHVRPVSKLRGVGTGHRGSVGQIRGQRLLVVALQAAFAVAALVWVYFRFESFLGNPLSSGLMTLSFGSAGFAVIDRFFGRHP